MPRRSGFAWSSRARISRRRGLQAPSRGRGSGDLPADAEGTGKVRAWMVLGERVISDQLLSDRFREGLILGWEEPTDHRSLISSHRSLISLCPRTRCAQEPA